MVIFLFWLSVKDKPQFTHICEFVLDIVKIMKVGYRTFLWGKTRKQTKNQMTKGRSQKFLVFFLLTCPQKISF
jgi:hypothetical protein